MLFPKVLEKNLDGSDVIYYPLIVDSVRPGRDHDIDIFSLSLSFFNYFNLLIFFDDRIVEYYISGLEGIFELVLVRTKNQIGPN